MTKVTELAIVKKVMTFLELGDAGKIGSFFQRQKVNAEKTIRDLKRNKITLINAYNDVIQDLKDKKEDFDEELLEAYLNVAPENVKNHKAMADFESIYWGSITVIQDALDDIDEKIKLQTEKNEKELKEIDEQIAKWEQRIDIITK